MSAESFALAAAQVEPVYPDEEGTLAKTCRWIELMVDLQKHNLHVDDAVAVLGEAVEDVARALAGR